MFDGVPFTGTIVGYDANHKLYQIKYTDGDQEEFYHNEVHAHKDPIKSSSPTALPTKKSPLLQLKKRKDIRRKHRTRRWRKNNNAQRIAATNFLYLAKFAPTNADFEEHEHELTIDDIRAITALRRT